MEITSCIKTIKDITGLDEIERQQLIKRYYKTSEIARIEIHAQADELYNKIVHQQKIGGRAEKFYSSLLLAIKKIVSLESYLERKNSKTYAEEKELTLLQILDAKKTKGKRRAKKRDSIIKNLYPIIKQLRDEKFSYRDIEKFLKKHHGKTISYVYLRTAFESEKKRRDLLI